VAEVGPVRVASVLNAELDRQHDECAAALEELATQRSTGALDAALSTIRRHFEYEEELLDRHLYPDLASGGAADGGMCGGFNADANMRTSHFADHSRIISAMEEKLAALRKGVEAEAGEASCGSGG